MVKLLKQLNIWNNDIVVLSIKNCRDMDKLRRELKEFNSRNGIKAFYLLTTDEKVDIKKLSLEEKEELRKLCG